LATREPIAARTTDEPRRPGLGAHDAETSQTPRPKVPKQPPALNPDPGALIERFHADLVELEGIAITADECVTALPVIPRGKYQRTTKRLYLLVGATAGRASALLERTEDALAEVAAGKRRAR
jgi:hypothetical protein